MKTQKAYCIIFLFYFITINNLVNGQENIKELYQCEERLNNNVKEVACYEYSFHNDKIKDSLLISNIIFEKVGTKNKIHGQSFYEWHASHCYRGDIGYDYKIWFHFECIIDESFRPLLLTIDKRESDIKKSQEENPCPDWSDDKSNNHFIDIDTITYKYKNDYLTNKKTHEFYKNFNPSYEKSEKQEEIYNHYFNSNGDLIIKEYLEINLNQRTKDTVKHNKKHYLFKPNGLIEKEIDSSYLNYVKKEKRLKQIITYHYKEDKLIKKIKKNSTTSIGECYYDNNGNLIKEYSQFQWNLDEEWHSSTNKYEYSEGIIKSKSLIRSDNSIKSEIYKYNNKGLLIEYSLNDPTFRKKILKKYFYHYN